MKILQLQRAELIQINKAKILLLTFFSILALISLFMHKPVMQDLAYHNFADQREMFGIPNFVNVISNLPFLLVGVFGFTRLKFSVAPPLINYIYSVLFAGILFTSVGSAFYHYRPNNYSLIYDRLPMTLVFMAFVSAVIAAWINVNAGFRFLLPLLFIGIGSVVYWNYTESKGVGDLRLYAFVQYFPMLLIPAIFVLFDDPVNRKGLFTLVWVLAWYIMAKILETFDKNIYTTLHFISGHSLKHIAASIAALL